MLRIPSLALVLIFAASFASADQTNGTVTIMDLTENPITADIMGGTNQVNQTVTADKSTPELISFSIDVDGVITAGTGVAVLKGGGVVSDILQITLTQRERGNGIKYFTASGTFTSDSDPGGLDLASLGLGLTDETIKKILDNGLIEDGTQQDIGSRLIDISNGNALSLAGLVVTAASDIPEPFSLLLVAGGLLALRVRSRRGYAAA